MAKLRLTYPTFQQPSQVTFGSGSVRTLVQASDMDDVCWFVSGSAPVRAIFERQLAKAGRSLAQVQAIFKPPGEPDQAMIDQGAAFLKEHAARRIVGLGGGSVLDWCRLSWARSAGLLDDDHARNVTVPAEMKTPELWLAPTTCATGAEAASVAVYLDQGEKQPVVCDAFLARRVVLDGQFLADLSTGELANLLADAVSHAVEAFISIVPNYLAKEAAASALGLILESYPAAPEVSRNERLLEAAYLAGLAASHCSVGVIHAFAHSVARWQVSHGHANALGLLPGIEANAETPALARLTRRLGLDGVSALVERLRPLAQTAIGHGQHDQLRSALAAADRCAELRAAMSKDVCLRTCPTTLDETALDAYLARVRAGMEAAA